MSPIDFITEVSPYALRCPIRIDGEECGYTILSYYYDDVLNQMVLDIEPIKEN